MKYKKELAEFLKRNDIKNLVEKLNEDISPESNTKAVAEIVDELMRLDGTSWMILQPFIKLLLRLKPDLLNNMIAIPDSMFRLYNKPTLDIPNNIKYIGVYAFATSEIENITIPDSVVMLGDYCFWMCHYLREIKLSDNINIIPVGAFSDCYLLKKIILPKNLNEFKPKIFQYSNNIKELVFPDTKEKFWNIKGLEHIKRRDLTIYCTDGNIEFK